MKYYDKFYKIHDLLKEYGCKRTFDFEEEYTENILLPCFTFYCTDVNLLDSREYDWREEVHAQLDVVIPTKMEGAIKGIIRFHIYYSDKVDKYSMHISLPTNSRSISLSKNVYQGQEDIIEEIKKWLIIARCKRLKHRGCKMFSQCK
ncbi:hypothetical protein [Caloramator sp. Dgby_cultured_2]|uniref:hypothetical protein n=1 Tax=Caloramator sp. Dgby_cultured_2 TaxID=3029174 RepID=UPI00237D65BB|nr:hypothetical protein [Caloramator sp. Dgby_cultured_2]WDU82296.1 hypothetical protein PWK10_11385 [Caloramator sp. Dgby_cultured_2]